MISAFAKILRKLNLQPLNDLFPQLDSMDVIEIYNPEGIQIFRSFHFFEYCSYDLETIFCRPWFELFSRAEEMNTAYMTAFNELINGKITSTVRVPVAEHIVTELHGDRLTLIKPNIFSPLPNGYLIHAFRVLPMAK